MAKPVIGVTGPRGQLGKQLVSWGCIPLECNVSDIDSIDKALTNVNPDIIINCAAKTNVDACETDLVETYKINTFAPQKIVDRFSGKFVHISSDYIFSGLEGPYSEIVEGNPVGTYGMSKYFAEVGLRGKKNVLVVRTTILYDSVSKNFPNSILQQLKDGKLVKVTDELYGTPTFIPHLSTGILHAIEHSVEGILNIVNDGNVSRYEFAKMLAEGLYDTSMIVRGPQFGEAKRGKKLGLKIEKAKQLGIPIYSLSEGIQDWKNEILRRQIDNGQPEK